LCAVLLLSGCASTYVPGQAARQGWAYYWQALAGHFEVMQAAQPVADKIADERTPAALRDKLKLTQRMRRFATEDMGLPDNASYTRYADLKRRAVVWNVIAAPELSLNLKTWCVPVLGCVGYRGYFSEAEAHALAAQLRHDDPSVEVAVYPVPAYSTLGWTNAFGGDPLLNTMMAYPEWDVLRLICHELAHQLIYVADDTAFNEAFASAVEHIAAQRWLARHPPAPSAHPHDPLHTMSTREARRQAFRALTLSTRQRLQEIYEKKMHPPLENNEKFAIDFNNHLNADFKAHQRRHKQVVMAEFRAQYTAWKAQWGADSGYDAWVAQANNATLALQGSYHDAVPAFLALYERQGQDLPRFYAAVRLWAALPKDQRLAVMAGHATATP
jgi:predicted aminopeptidase